MFKFFDAYYFTQKNLIKKYMQQINRFKLNICILLIFKEMVYATPLKLKGNYEGTMT